MDTFKVFMIVLFSMFIGDERIAADVSCYTFHGNSYIKFDPSGNFNNNNSIHYEMQFKTQTSNGLLMFARGPFGDYEALYIRGGKLHYLLFNTARSGIERQFGGHYVSEEQVDTNAWITVHLYRMMPVTDVILRTSHSKTGIEFDLNNRRRSYVDHLERTDIEISPSIYFGGYGSPLSDTLTNFNFTGEIRGIKEHKNGHDFGMPNLNYKRGVDLECFN